MPSGAAGMPSGAAGMPSGAAGMSGAPNAVVMSVEAMPRPSASGAGSAAMGSSGAEGATGSSGGGAMYRVTLRMDDGTTRVVTQDSAPNFRSGDRVHLMDGSTSH